MDKQYSVKFFTSFVEAMQKLCREYLDFDQGVELSGYLAVEIDNFKKERYVLSELVQSTGNVISESYCTKAFKTLRKELPPKISNVHGSENIAPRDHMNRTNRSHSEEVAIILRDSPETVHHSNYPMHTTTHKPSGHNQRHAFHQSPRSQTLSNRHRESASISISNPFELSSPSNRHHHQQQHQQPFEIQPRCSDSIIPSPSKTPQKRTIVDVDAPHSSPATKRDKLDNVEPGIESLIAATENVESRADLESIQNIYSTAAATTTTTSTSSSSEPLRTTLEGSSEPTGNESLRMPIGVDIKQEKDDDAAFMIIENPNDPTVKMLEAEGMFGGERETSQTLGLDTSTSFSADSQGGEHGDYKDPGNLGDTAGTSWDSSNQQSQPWKTQNVGYEKVKNDSARSTESGYVCVLCNKTYIYAKDLKRHRESVHEGIRFPCKFCGRTFSSVSNVNFHTRRFHKL